MDDPVMVVVGEWHCLEMGNWRFRLSKEKFARYIDIGEDESYAELQDRIAAKFDVDVFATPIMLSFWCEGEETVMTQAKIPPVEIECGIGMAKFRELRKRKKVMVLYMTIRERFGKESARRGGAALEDELVVEAVANAETEHRERLGRKGKEGDDGLEYLLENPVNLTCEGSDFLDQVDEIERVYREQSFGVARLNNAEKMKGKAVDTGSLSRCCGVEGYSYSSEDYDFDVMREMIEQDYPPDWNPYALVTETTGYVAGVDTFTSSRLNDIGLVDVTMSDAQVCENVHTMNCILSERRTLTPIGFSLGIENGSLGSEAGRVQETLVASSHEELANGDKFGDNGTGRVINTNAVGRSGEGFVNVTVNEVSSLEERMGDGKDCSTVRAPVALDEIQTVDVSILDTDDMLLLNTVDTPCRDNVRGVYKDKANMNLRKRGDAVYVGKVYRDKAELYRSLSVYAMKRLFNFRISASDPTRVIAVCVDKNCHWRVYATNHKGSENMEIRTATLRHSCDVSSRSQYCKKATARILGDLLKAKYEHGKKGPRACELPEMVLAELNVTISYMKAWNAKELAMKNARGTEEEGYKFLSTYLHLLKESNPGTLTSMHTTRTREGVTLFRYLFFAFGASVAGYAHLRKVIVIDGTQTRGKYKSCLVAASGQDGNYQIFPLAFGVVDGENIAGWTWFFEQLKKFVPDEEDLVFVSDRHAAIYAGLKKVYPLAKHGACAVHLFRNVKHAFKCEGLATIVDKAARAYTVGDFRYWFKEVEKRKPACAEYLIEIGLQHWTLAYFPGMRYNLMSSNISESLNAALQKAVDYPIVTMVEAIRTKLMEWFFKRREKAKKTLTKCTPEIEELLIEHLKEATDCAVISSSEWMYQVNDGDGLVFTVDLAKKTCTCRVFDVLLVPCSHALAAVSVRNLDYYSLVGRCYFVDVWRELWTGLILPPPKERDSKIPASLTENHIHPPKTRRGSGRPRKVRIRSQGEHLGPPGKKAKLCGTCGKAGHNRGTCKNPI